MLRNSLTIVRSYVILSNIILLLWQFYIVAMAILPEGASGKEIFFKNTF